MPSYQGIFIEELSKNANKIIFFGFETLEKENDCTYEIKRENIEFINLGSPRKFYYLLFLGSFFLRNYKNKISECTNFLVRAPSPLSVYFGLLYHNRTRVTYLLVGSYQDSLKFQQNNLPRKIAINFVIWLYEKLQKKAFGKCSLIVNSPALKEAFSISNSSIKVVYTTTLTNDFFYFREYNRSNLSTKILFVGRIERVKGIEDLYTSYLSLRELGYNVELVIVGWETILSNKYKEEYMNGKFSNQIHFLGFLSGEKLERVFESADLFVMPSYNEGFPRVIWEAMAKGLPIVATKVGAIPHYLKHNHNSFLYEAGDVNELTRNLVKIIDEKISIKEIISNGYDLVKDITLEYQTKILMNSITNEIE